MGIIDNMNGIFGFLRSKSEPVTGGESEFEALLRAGDIQAVQERMTDRWELIENALADYNIFNHPINYREDKIVTDKAGNFVRREKTWKIPISYPVYINEVALVFLYGRPVKWIQQSGGTERAFEAFIDLIKRTRFDSKLRQAKRLAGAETESALLFRAYRDNDGKPDVQIRVLARSKGDEIYTRWDQYENLLAVAWGYYVKENVNDTVYHFDVFTPKTIYRCRRVLKGYEVKQEENLIGKIPIILFQQEKEWADSEPLLHRLEYIASRTADTNDYFADPIAIMNADIVRNMPEKSAANKLLITKGGEGVDAAAKYLTWDSAPQSKKDEVEWIEEKIYTMTFTPKISLDSLKNVSQLSAKALNTVMLLANVKAARRKESHDELLDRTASLITAIIANVTDISLAGECANLVVNHQFQEPFGDDITEMLDNIVKAYNAGIISTEGAVELNPLVKDAAAEIDRINKEAEERAQAEKDLFSQTETESDKQGTEY